MTDLDLDAITADIDMAARSPEMARHVALDHAADLIAEIRRQRSRVDRAEATIQHVQAVCAQVETDDADHIARHGQHLYGSVVTVAEMIRTALDTP